jgi:hypothetical protein
MARPMGELDPFVIVPSPCPITTEAAVGKTVGEPGGDAGVRKLDFDGSQYRQHTLYY